MPLADVPKKVNLPKWFLAVIFDTIITVLCTTLIPTGSALSVLTFFFGFTYVALVPGYCLVKLLFPEGKLDIVEKVVLSIALSFSLAGVSGLFLGLSPIGLTFRSIIVSLVGLVVLLAILALLRQKGMLHMRKNQISQEGQAPS